MSDSKSTLLETRTKAPVSEDPKSEDHEVGGQSLRLISPADGGRLDQVVAGLVPGQSRTRIQEWVRAGRVAVEGKVVTKPGLRLLGGERIRVEVPPIVPVPLAAEAIPLEVVYEDSDLMIVNKPPGMVVHPAPGHPTHTLVNAVLAHAPDIGPVGGEIRPGIVHRLDRDTSGLIVVAKNEATLRDLQNQFSRRTVAKQYLAITDGHPPAREGRIEAAIGRDPRHRQRMAVVPDGRGRSAATTYRVREGLERHALLELTPESGRTHQLRVHLAFVGCPVVGDRVYGRRTPTLDVARQMLHAWRLTFRLPGGNRPERSFEATIPADMAAALESARGLVVD